MSHAIIYLVEYGGIHSVSELRRFKQEDQKFEDGLEKTVLRQCGGRDANAVTCKRVSTFTFPALACSGGF